jgi:hypothetical protein
MNHKNIMMLRKAVGMVCEKLYDTFFQSVKYKQLLLKFVELYTNSDVLICMKRRTDSFASI